MSGSLVGARAAARTIPELRPEQLAGDDGYRRSRRWSRAALPPRRERPLAQAFATKPSNCVGKLREYRRTGRGRPREGAESGQSTAGTLLCSRCKAAQMAEVTAIAPRTPSRFMWENEFCRFSNWHTVL